MGQQTVVGGTVAVEERDVRLHVGHREGLVVAVALIDAVQAAEHAAALAVGDTGAQQQQREEDGQ